MDARGVLLVKWGGSLITDKRTPGSPCPEVIERLAGEIAGIAAQRPGGVVLGHGSGSFGHVAASRHGTAEGIGRGTERQDQLKGLCETQDQAAQLHRLVMKALGVAGVPAFSIVASSAMTAGSGESASIHLDPLARALDLGLLPVIYGDVVLDRDRGSSIFSTEKLFLILANELPARGHRVQQAFWLGETDGIHDREGRRIPTIERGESGSALDAAGASGGTDVTGGMQHRLTMTLELASLGVESWILDGRTPGVLGDAVGGRLDESEGTRVVAGA
ncbi:MAG: isopentenyl phosphate kinase [Acidobacteriota bacterium]|nr:isopentenyl phosphate kinase [Acidobacteriota bacterium]